MTDATPERRPFQFSLRKALLWMVVWALYLGYLRWSYESPYFTALDILCSGILLTIRLIYGYRSGLLRAAVLTGGVPVGLLIMVFVFSEPGEVHPDAVPFLLLWCVLGVVVGMVAFTLVHVLVTAIDWIDRKMEMESKPQPSDLDTPFSP